MVNLVDSVFGRVIKYVDLGIGFGNNWILQGSLQDQKTDGNTTTYVFLSEKQHLIFVNKMTQTLIVITVVDQDFYNL